MQYDPEEVFNTALQLFWSQGYEGTSLQDLLRETGLSRSSFYQAFENKRGLYLHCLQKYSELAGSELLKTHRQSGGGLDFFAAHFNGIAENGRTGADKRGCMIMNAANEFEQSAPDVAEIVQQGAAKARAVYLKALQEAKSRGDFASGTDLDALADFLFLFQSGLRTMAKAGMSRSRLKETVRIVLATLI